MQTSAGAAPIPADAQDAFTALNTLMQAKKCAELLDLYANPKVATMLATLPVAQKQVMNGDGVICAGQAKQFELALKFAIAGTELHDANPWFWFRRMDMEWATGKHAALISTMETMATTHPDALAMVNLSWVGSVNNALHASKETDLRKRLYAVFGAPGFHPADPGVSADGYRRAAAADAVDAGHPDAAAAILAQVTNAQVLLYASLDPRLRAFVPGFDARAAAERNLEIAREVAAAHPDDLGATFAVTRNYVTLDKGAEILALLLPMQPGKAHPNIRATDEQVRGWWSQVAMAYRFLGDYDKAIATLQHSMAPGEVNEKNLPELTEIAGMHLRFGHFAAALAVLDAYNKATSDMNASGQSYFRKLHGCAAWLDGKRDLAEADLAYLRLHDDNVPGNVIALLLCMHRDDEPAASYIKDLATPDKLPATLAEFSTFDPPPKTDPHDWFRDAIERLKMRPDVTAAIAKAGGAGHFDIPPL